MRASESPSERRLDRTPVEPFESPLELVSLLSVSVLVMALFFIPFLPLTLHRTIGGAEGCTDPSPPTDGPERIRWTVGGAEG